MYVTVTDQETLEEYESYLEVLAYIPYSAGSWDEPPCEEEVEFELHAVDQDDQPIIEKLLQNDKVYKRVEDQFFDNVRNDYCEPEDDDYGVY